MKLKVITLTNQPEHPGYQLLKKSLDHFGYDWHCIEAAWRGFGTKIIETAAYLETIKGEYTHFVFLDAHDTFAWEYEEELLNHLPNLFGLISAEKACYPDANLWYKYPATKSDWKFVNSGSYFMPIPMFLDIVAEFPIEYGDDDQLWLSKVFLSHKYALHLDYDCRVFQSMAFEAEDDFRYGGYSIENQKTKTIPFFFHFNGKTENERAYNMVKKTLNEL